MYPYCREHRKPVHLSVTTTGLQSQIDDVIFYCYIFARLKYYCLLYVGLPMQLPST